MSKSISNKMKPMKCNGLSKISITHNKRRLSLADTFDETSKTKCPATLSHMAYHL
jgi:hypothetical protein